MIRPVIGRSDPWLLLPALLLVPLGVLMVYSASPGAGAEPFVSGPVLRQLLIAVAGVALMLALARLDYRWFQRLSAPGYVTAVLLLLAVLAVGVSEFGARRWLGASGLAIQPSELAKPALALALASYMSERRPAAVALMGALALLAAPAALVLLQPDTGTAIVLAGAWVGAVVAWGAPWRVLGSLAAAIVALAPLLFTLAVPGYQRERIAVFLDPARDPLGSGFNLRQAEAALRSGGLTGRGLFDGARSALDGVGARSSDFMFAHIGEQLGLLGSVLLLSLFGLLIWRGLRASRMAPDAFGRLLAAALTLMLFTQAFVHTAVNLRLFPATGVPLPFVSQGGSSLVAMCVAAGLLLSVATHRPLDPRAQSSHPRSP
jgi:rod shape determining protein RodA